MSIHELLAKFDAGKLQVQFLSECATSINAGKGGAKVTFETDALTPNALVGESEPVGMIVWIPRDEWNRKARQ